VATAKDTTRLAATRCRRERLERGTASWVTMVLLLGLAAAAYAAVVFVPPAVLQYEVKQVVRDYGNQAVKSPEDEVLVKGMIQKIRTLQQEPGVDAAGARIWIPVIDLQREDIVWERDRESKPPTLHVAFEYPRTIELPWLDRSVERVFRVDLTMDISRPDWGPPR